MNKKNPHGLLVAAMLCLSTAVAGQEIELRGVKANARYDNGDTYISEYLGWDSTTGTARFHVDQGLWKLTPTEDTVRAEVAVENNLMYANSGAVYKNDTLVTVYSRESDEGEGKMEFRVRWWKASDGTMLREATYPQSANIESRGMTYCHADGKVYGLFHLTDVALPVPAEELDPEDQQEGLTSDAGYALCTIDLETMKLTQITPGIYYDNFVALACSPDGRLFSMTASGTLCELNRQTGMIETRMERNAEGEMEEVNKFGHSGVQSQFKRQAACFDFMTGKMYWNGFVNSGMGYNDHGSWSSLPDREWRTNGKYDTALYEVDTETGKATRVGPVQHRLSLACMWVAGRDASDPTGIAQTTVSKANGEVVAYTIGGSVAYRGHKAGLAMLAAGAYIVKDGNETRKIVIK